VVDGGGGGLIILFSVHIVYRKLHLIYTKKVLKNIPEARDADTSRAPLVILGFGVGLSSLSLSLIDVVTLGAVGPLLLLSPSMMVVVTWPHGNVVVVAIGGCYCYYCCSVIVVEKENRPGARDASSRVPFVVWCWCWC
jgi:hypothetical protein